MKSTTTFICVFFLHIGLLIGQIPDDRIATIEKKLNTLGTEMGGLNEPVEISLSNVSIQEFVRAIAVANELNVSVDQRLNIRVTNNFNNASAKDILIHLCKEYSLDIEFTGSIISLKQYVPPPAEIPQKFKTPVDIEYAEKTDLISLNVKNDTLFEVAKRITELSGYNVVISPGLELTKVSGFIKNRPFEQALNNFAFANGLEATPKPGKFYVLEKAGDKSTPDKPEFGKNTAQITSASRPQVAGLMLDAQNDRVTVRAKDVSINEIIMSVAYELNAHYYLFSSPENKTTLYVENASFSDFLSYLFSGSEYTFKLSEDIYLIGKRNQERLRSTELITLENRTIESVQDAIPQELKKGLEIKEFPDLNGLIVSGSYTSIAEVNAFLRKIDRPVPVVLIDIMIVEVKKNFNVETGFQLTLDGESVPLSTTGEYNQSGAGISATLTSKTLNAILSSFTAPGLVNLGNLSPNFYASIQALESNGIIKRKSTPKLATMNGSEASLSLGEQTFYAETNNSFIGAQSPALSESTIYKPISADMTINIKPSVSSDEQITLSIDFSQSSFTNRIAETAPPGSLTKTFSSKIRVKNGETILLGGLDEEAHEKTGKGLPLIARIPILKWLLGSNTRSDSKSQISIFIQPTVIY